MSHYTDEMLREAECAIGLADGPLDCHLCQHPRRDGVCPRHAAEAALDAIAPAIAALALRRAADVIVLADLAWADGTPSTDQEVAEIAAEIWLRTRAAEIEGT